MARRSASGNYLDNTGFEAAGLCGAIKRQCRDATYGTVGGVAGSCEADFLGRCGFAAVQALARRTVVFIIWYTWMSS